jgi:hypothetical protein
MKKKKENVALNVPESEKNDFMQIPSNNLKSKIWPPCSDWNCFKTFQPKNRGKFRKSMATRRR